LNHFTVPLAIDKTPPLPLHERAGRRYARKPNSFSLVRSE
jgi:hypothetical protein